MLQEKTYNLKTCSSLTCLNSKTFLYEKRKIVTAQLGWSIEMLLCTDEIKIAQVQLG